MNTSISTKQLQYTASAFIVGSVLLTSNLYVFARNDSWFSVLLGFVFSLVLIAVYSALAKRYPGRSLTEINEAVFGKYPGKVVTALYSFYFLSLAFFNTRDLGDFVKGFLLPSTPIMFFFVFLLIVCAYAVRKGPVIMTRYGLILTLIALFSILINSLLLINKMNPKNLQPVLTLPLGNYLIGAHIVTMLPFCEIFAFMMFLPHMKKPGEIGRALRGALYIGGVTLLFVVLRDTMAIGKFTSIYGNPTFSVIRMIDVGDILTRLEVVYAFYLMMLFFLKVSVVFFAAVSCTRSLFGMRSYGSLINVIGVLIAVYAMASFTEVAEHVQWNLTAAATYSSFFLLVLPVLTLLVSSVRGSGNRSINTGEC
jgi:spore germination protein KB